MAASIQTVSVTAAEEGRVEVTLKITVDHLTLVECGAELIRAGMQAFDGAPPPRPSDQDRVLWEALEEIREIVLSNNQKITGLATRITPVFLSCMAI